MFAVRFFPLVLGLAACVPGQVPPGAHTGAQTGAQDFMTLCAPCHGTSGKGDGEMAPGLAHPPADLTRISARHGGVFPKAYVMSKIWGYEKGGAPGALMPKFAPLMEGPTVLVDTGDGIQTPTPLRLVEIATYVESIQGK
ncbi:cytochrome C [bacterium]|nr:cytochrome C [bacterium]